MAGGPGEAKLNEAFAHCASLVEQADPDRATAILFAAPEKRPFLHALYAFDLEVASVRERVTQPIPGEIRLQWWRERIEAASARGEEASPVAAALAETIRRCDLPVPAFDRLLEARIFDLYDDPMPTREAFETYAGETASTVVTLAAMVLDRDAASAVAGLAGHAGVALVAFDLAAAGERRSLLVPQDLLASLGLDAADDTKDGRGRVSRAMDAYGREHARPVIESWALIPRAIRPAFLPLRSAIARAAKPDAAPSRFSALARTARYWRAMRSGES